MKIIERIYETYYSIINWLAESCENNYRPSIEQKVDNLVPDSNPRRFRLTSGEQPKSFMTRKEYREFADRFMERVKPDLDKQARRRARSWDKSHDHRVS